MVHEGDNGYLKEKGGLPFGVRHTLVSNEAGDCIIPVSLALEREGATLTSLMNDNLVHSLKYEETKFKSLDKANITPEMIQLLDQYMEKSKMCDDHHYL